MTFEPRPSPLPVLVLSLLTLSACPGDDGTATTTDGDSTTTGTSGVQPTVTAAMTMGATTTSDGQTSTGEATTMSVDTTADTTAGTTGGSTEGTTGGSTEGTTEASTGGSTAGTTEGSSSTGMAMACGGACVPDEELCEPVSGQCLRLLACDVDGSDLDQVNLTTYAAVSTTMMTIPGGPSVGGCTGLAYDFVGGDLYMVLTEGPGANFGRQLAVVDPVTGVVTIVGVLPEVISSIAVDDAGTLYGMSGQGTAPSNVLYTIDTATAATNLVVDVADEPINNTDGEAIGFSPTTGLVYRWSGNGDPKLFSSIDPGTMIETSIPPSLVLLSEVTAATFVPAGPLADRFLVGNLDNEAVSVQTDGTYTNEGTFTGALGVYKGLAFVPM